MVSVEERLAALEREVMNMKEYMHKDVVDKISSMCSKIEKRFILSEEKMDTRFIQTLRMILVFTTSMIGLVAVILLWAV